MKAYFINLPERKDKYWGQKVSLHLAGWRESLIIPFPGINAQKFPDYKSIASGMKKEGFNNFTENHGFSKGALYSNWSHLRILQKIVRQKDECALVLEDDTFIYRRNRNDLLSIINTIGKEKIDLLFLDWHINDLEGIISFVEVVSWMEKSSSNILKNTYFQGSRARLWTYEGARRFLKIWKSAPYITSENLPIFIGIIINGKDYTSDNFRRLYGHWDKLADIINQVYSDRPPQFYALDPKGAVDLSFASILEKKSDK